MGIKLYFSLFFIVLFNTSFSQDTGDFLFEDKVYDPYIKTVQLYATTPPQPQTQSPAIGITSSARLLLEFDELFNEAYDYKAKIIHCNADWNPSGLSPLQYLKEYNEFDILDFDYSFGTLTEYVHYKFVLPKPVISGNYLLVVYAEDETDIIITRRFMVYEQRVTFSSKSEILSSAPYSLTKQFLHFNVNYQGIELINPTEYVKVNILQNSRWDNAQMAVKPTVAREAEKRLEYKEYTENKAFDAGNEFRYFDIRSLKYFGFHVRTVSFKKDKILAWVETDKPRTMLAYGIENNNNGQFIIENLERKNPIIENDYALVTFKLETPEINDKVYISGKFTDWKNNKETLMIYNDAINSYEGSYVLKQGQYDYQYVLGSENKENDLEGNKREAKNIYEILVYYRSQQLGVDLLIGYSRLNLGLR